MKNSNDTVKKLYLSNDDKRIYGVCGGIAEYFEVDPTVVRLAWVILTLVSGIIPGLVAYILAIIIMPQQRIVDLQELHSKHA